VIPVLTILAGLITIQWGAPPPGWFSYERQRQMSPWGPTGQYSRPYGYGDGGWQTPDMNNAYRQFNQWNNNESYPYQGTRPYGGGWGGGGDDDE
jgi:hypothetical protein